VDEGDRVTLRGNTHPAVAQARDLGPVADNLELHHIYLQLRRSDEAQRTLDAYVEELHNPASPHFHQWGTPAEFSQRFGLAHSDILTVKSWLESKGFTVHEVHPNLTIDFSGTAGAVREAFHTSIHRLAVNGATHIANMSDPQIPAALAGVVIGPVALHDFKPRPLVRPLPQYTLSGGFEAVAPPDLHTIYNLDPLYQAGITGKGQTIGILARTDLYSEGDWYAFRKVFGLSRRFPYGTFKTIHPQSRGEACTDPGVNSDDVEAAVDTEWASASAPNAAIVMAACADTETNVGFLIALQNMLTNGSAPAVVSLSYGSPEGMMGSDFNQYVNQLYQFAVFQGVSVFVSSGDQGAAVGDLFDRVASHGIEVNGFASTPNNIAVGGTDFADTYFGVNSSYWSATNGPNYGSAKSYVPEIPWNSTCASELIAGYVGYPTTYGANGFCNSSFGQASFLNILAAGGGPSECASGTPDIFGVIGGSCKGYAKPAFQSSVFGNPNDGVRDLPDISLMSGGVWSHYYILCYSDPAGGGSRCNTPPATWSGGIGTSFAAPIMAGIQALTNQAASSRQGNANYAYYAMARSEFGSSGKASCNASLGNASNPECIFHDVRLGDIDVPCQPFSGGGVTGRFDCFYPTTNPGTYGVLSTSNTSYQPAFRAAPGWDFATGLGSINVYNLVANWPAPALSAKRK
jgi:subtilase family serine protease